MKTRTIIIIVTFLWGSHVAGYAQNFIDEDKQWSIVSHLFESEDYHTKILRFSGDSAINGQTYYKLYQTTVLNQTNWTLHSLWQEKNDSVYKYDFVTGKNRLLYDFNLEAGDTFRINEFQRLAVDSIVYRNWNGISKKHWYISDADDYIPKIIIWVEGVGNMECFFHPPGLGVSGAFVELLCFHENDNLLYQNPKFESCYVNVGVKEIADLDLPVSFEVLGSGNIRIVFKEGNPTGQINFYNLSGQQILSLKTNQIDGSGTICHLPNPGIYLCNYVSSEGKTMSQKILAR
jgi:hypothetical protein